MSPDIAEKILCEWTELLRAVDAVALDCEMSVEEMTDGLARRQQAIDRIQQLDAPLKELALLVDADSKYSMSFSIRELLEEGRTVSARIRIKDAQLIENAAKKKREVSGNLRCLSKAKGYSASAFVLKVRPPVIVDKNA